MGGSQQQQQQQQKRANQKSSTVSIGAKTEHRAAFFITSNRPSFGASDGLRSTVCLAEPGNTQSARPGG
jgi:hypothetical protein